MVDTFGAPIFAFVAAAFIATWLKHSGGPFRLLVGLMIFLPVGTLFISAYMTSAPLMALAIIAGFLLGLFR